ncbi:MAG: ribonuclease HI [Nitrospirae bacterium]|jgi:ribonuclease HI|nr:ribonuclease HI [Nitrospirota bacterium]
MDEVDLYTDGACSGNPGPGGWGALLSCRGTERELSGGEPATTNNRMELLAVISGLRALKKPCRVTVHTDSQYVKNGMTTWIKGWKKNGFRTASGSPVKNEDLWRELDRLSQSHEVVWKWVRGHDGHVENERVDALARAAIPGRVK